MKVSESDKIIAEYMGLTVYPKYTEFMPQDMTHVRVDFLNYSKSLDALVPVWLKINRSSDLNIQFYSDTMDQFNFFFTDLVDEEFVGYESEIFKETIQQAAAISTARCILELGEQGE